MLLEPNNGSPKQEAPIWPLFATGMKASGNTLLRTSEYKLYLNALEGFGIPSEVLSYQRKIHNETTHVHAPTSFKIVDKQRILTEIIDKDTEKEENLFWTVMSGMSDCDAYQTLVDYVDAGGRIALLRKKHPPAEFINRFLAYSEEHFHGLAMLTETVAAYHGMRIIRDSEIPSVFEMRDETVINKVKPSPTLFDDGQPRNLFQLAKDATDIDARMPEINEEYQLEELAQMARETNSLHFAALTPENGTDVPPKEVSAAMKELNKELDRYEYAYNVISASTAVEKKQFMVASTILAGSAVGPEALGGIMEGAGPIAAMTIAHTAGDLADQALNSADRIAEHILSIPRKIFDYATHKKKVQRKEKKQDHSIPRKELLKRRLALVGLNLSIALVFSTLTAHLAQIPDIPDWVRWLPFLATGPLNKGLAYGCELLERLIHVRSVHGTLTKREKEATTDYLQEHFPPVFEKILEGHPEVMQAFSDINKPATYALLGSVISLPIMELCIAAGLPLTPELIMTLSGFAFDSGFTALLSGKDLAQDQAWKRFKTVLPLLTKFDREYDHEQALIDSSSNP